MILLAIRTDDNAVIVSSLACPIVSLVHLMALVVELDFTLVFTAACIADYDIFTITMALSFT